MDRAVNILLAILAVLALISVFFILFHSPLPQRTASPSQAASPAALSATSSTGVSTTSSITLRTGTTTLPSKPQSTSTAPVIRAKPKPTASLNQTVSTTTASNEVTRIQNPYTVSPQSVESVNATARGAMVNILCTSRSNSSLHPISGSGVIIDARGVILTNAHVAQYVLLSESQRIDLSCMIRSGSPAQAKWNAEVLFIPPAWVKQHYSEINSAHAQGTGEYDYALLRITRALTGPLPAQFPAVSIDTRERIAFLSDSVVAAGYPAEFVGGGTAQNMLYPVSSVSTVGQLLTFSNGTIDLISIGSVIEAQSGASGGPVLNLWAKLVGIITTTSSGATTRDRELRAITLSYIDRNMLEQTGFTLSGYLDHDLADRQQAFSESYFNDLLNLYIGVLH